MWCSSNLPKVCEYAQTVRSHPFRSKWKMSKTPLIPLFCDWTVTHWMCFCLWTNDFICYRFNVMHFFASQKIGNFEWNNKSFTQKRALGPWLLRNFGCLRYTYLVFAGDNVIANRFQYDSWWVVFFKTKKQQWSQQMKADIALLSSCRINSTMEFDLFDFSTHF